MAWLAIFPDGRRENRLNDEPRVGDDGVIWHAVPRALETYEDWTGSAIVADEGRLRQSLLATVDAIRVARVRDTLGETQEIRDLKSRKGAQAMTYLSLAAADQAALTPDQVALRFQALSADAAAYGDTIDAAALRIANGMAAEEATIWANEAVAVRAKDQLTAIDTGPDDLIAAFDAVDWPS